MGCPRREVLVWEEREKEPEPKCRGLRGKEWPCAMGGGGKDTAWLGSLRNMRMRHGIQ